MKRAYSMEINNLDSGIPSKVRLVEKVTNPGGVQLVNPYTATKASNQDLVALATEIQKADNFITANASNKLQVIADNMRFLKQQAEKNLLETKEHIMLHHAACNFIKHPGNIYHLYEKVSGECYLSMLSPEEWGNNGPKQIFKGSYRLENDQSWTPVSHIKAKDTLLSGFKKHLFRSQDLALSSSQVMNIE